MTAFIGVDVSSTSLDVAFGKAGAVEKFSNNTEGILSLISRLKTLPVKLVAFESSGGYERALMYALAESKINVALLNPKQVRDFAKAKGILAKTDRLDAKVIAHFAEVMEPRIEKVKTQEEQELEDLLRRRSQLIDMLVMEKNRHCNARGSIRLKIREMIEVIEKKVEEIEKDLDNKLKDKTEWNLREEALDEIKGIGKTTARSLLIDIPELGTLTDKQVAALSGLAPYHVESGKMNGVRRTSRGRKRVKKYLYMCVLSAIRVEGELKNFYERLIGKGKKAMVALVACMRKLIVMANATLRKLLPAPA